MLTGQSLHTPVQNIFWKERKKNLEVSFQWTIFSVGTRSDRASHNTHRQRTHFVQEAWCPWCEQNSRERGTERPTPLPPPGSPAGLEDCRSGVCLRLFSHENHWGPTQRSKKILFAETGRRQFLCSQPAVWGSLCSKVSSPHSIPWQWGEWGWDGEHSAGHQLVWFSPSEVSRGWPVSSLTLPFPGEGDGAGG